MKSTCTYGSSRRRSLAASSRRAAASNATSPHAPAAPRPAARAGAAAAPADPGKGGILFTRLGRGARAHRLSVSAGDADDARSSTDGRCNSIGSSSRSTRSRSRRIPTRIRGDQSKTGAVVAEVDGPWAVDLHRGGPDTSPARAAGRASRADRRAHERRRAATPFATDGTRYAFGFDIVAATAQREEREPRRGGARRLREMVENGCAVLYVGTATFKGDKTRRGLQRRPTTRAGRSASTSSSASSRRRPTSTARILTTPATPFPSEEHQRGIALDANAVGHRAGDDPHRSPVLGQRPPRLARALRSVRGARRRPRRRRPRR